MAVDIGQVFGSWTILETSVRRRGEYYCRCQCQCGRVKLVKKNSLTSGMSTRCRSCASRRHGECSGHERTPEHLAWQKMLERCSPSHERSDDYIERGITVCEEWQGQDGYIRFLEHVGRRPSPDHSLDRRDNDRGYEPGNVRWATQKEQQRNKRNNRLVTAWGRTQCLAAWSEDTGIPASTLWSRLFRSGWAPERALVR